MRCVAVRDPATLLAGCDLRQQHRYTRLLLQRVCEQTGVRSTPEVPPGVDVIRRKSEDASFLFVLNHNEVTVVVRLLGSGRDLLTDTEYDSHLVPDLLEVAVLKEVLIE